MGCKSLFDSVLSVSALPAQITKAKKTLALLDIPVTVSDIGYGFTKDGGSEAALQAIDQISRHELLFFSSECGIGMWNLIRGTDFLFLFFLFS
jgi:hypothetical protein